MSCHAEARSERINPDQTSRSRPMYETLCATLISLTFAGSALAHENPSSVQEDGRFTPNIGGEQFPPQPRNISSVRQYTPQPEAAVSPSLLASDSVNVMNRLLSSSADSPADVGTIRSHAVQTALAHADVLRALGARFTVLDSVPVRSKSNGSKDRFRVNFFSFDKNETVSAIYANGGIESVTSMAASEQQPPLGDAEMARAIVLAKRHWESKNVWRVNILNAYAIQTFKEDGAPYENRVAYVSFHTDSPEPPELVTWVDLTNEVVFRSEVAQ